MCERTITCRNVVRQSATPLSKADYLQIIRQQVVEAGLDLASPMPDLRPSGVENEAPPRLKAELEGFMDAVMEPRGNWERKVGVVIRSESIRLRSEALKEMHPLGGFGLLTAHNSLYMTLSDDRQNGGHRLTAYRVNLAKNSHNPTDLPGPIFLNCSRAPEAFGRDLQTFAFLISTGGELFSYPCAIPALLGGTWNLVGVMISSVYRGTLLPKRRTSCNDAKSGINHWSNWARPSPIRTPGLTIPRKNRRA